ncbi:MAG TPA: siroheme synthase CysG [Steroidobacteraceae bacterium]|nr:siroheme synthase CysG [Steroidobacteraceae bacterium]
MDYLPVFLDLAMRRVLVVGGGAVAARKVELLLQARALVRVVAPRLHPALSRARDAGRIEHIGAPFEPRHLEDVVLAIAATDRPEINRAVAAAGAALRVFVNVVDDAGASSCILPAIVDRSPVIVAVGTSAHSPALARRVRAQLEEWLPERLGELARLAAHARARVRRALPDASRRRRFWDRLLAGRVASQVLAGQAAGAEALLEEELAAAVSGGQAGGEVYLIGAGPGDPDLLTLRAQQLLQQADVVLYDRLVAEAVLARARRDALRIFVGKQTGRHRVTQERIHTLLLEYAGRGLRVARLKGGDPLVFARGGEEIEVLRRAGVPVIVVPGITAALGAAASAGLPLTQRGVSQAVTLVTAMGEGAAALDWRALAAPLQTVVVYMGVAQLPRIVERLLAHGAPAARAAAIVEQATLPAERVIAGTLATIVQQARAAQVGAPALLIVGEVAAQAAAARACQAQPPGQSLPPTDASSPTDTERGA